MLLMTNLHTVCGDPNTLVVVTDLHVEMSQMNSDIPLGLIHYFAALVESHL